MLNKCLRFIGEALARFISQPSRNYKPLATVDPERFLATIRPGDVLLVEGNTRVSVAIKYLTQSTWSHAALCVGMRTATGDSAEEPMLVEADIIAGIRLVPARSYADMHTRLCRPLGLSEADTRNIIETALARIGQTYDLKNIFDLARYLLPTPPVPTRWRRRMLALGSGEPTKAICSTFIAQLFQSVRYPILPEISRRPSADSDCNTCYDEILHIRHYSLFTPRDFDISPYFQIVKPSLVGDFDYQGLRWE